MAAQPRVTEVTEGLFRIDASASAMGSLLGALAPREESLDPFRVAQGLRGALGRCRTRSALGVPLLWNDFHLFLSAGDLARLRPMEGRIVGELHQIVRQEAARLRAELPGPVSIRLLVDEGAELPAGSMHLRAGFKEGPSRALANTASSPDATVRAGAPAAPLAEPHRPLDLETSRISEPTSPPRLQVTWAGGGVLVPNGVRVCFGRAHDPAPPFFVALPGANPRISRRHLWIEAPEAGPTASWSAPSAVIGRFNDANPVQVEGRTVQPGTSLSVERLPVEILLSSNEMLLVLEETRGTEP